MTLLTNSFEGGTNGTTLTTGNTGGASGNAFDAVNIGTGAANTFDNAQAAHGTLSNKVSTTATVSSCYDEWNTSMGTLSQVWFRGYYYFTANPAATVRLWSCLVTSTTCAAVRVTTTGTLQFTNTGGTVILTSTATVPLNQWFRVEGFVIGSATVGQMEMKLFKTADSSTPDETDTSTAVQNTSGSPNTYRFGVTSALANAGPYWMDDLGLSDSGYIGPAVAAAASVQPLVVPSLAAIQAATW